MPNYNLNINGTSQQVDVAEDTPLLWVLRDHLDLVGTKYGCGIAQCGACAVHIDGNAIRSCTMPVSLAEGLKIITIEGLSSDGTHPVQKAWEELDVPQCGYCQAGQIMTATAFLKNNSTPSKEEIRQAMQGNICRCTSYNRIEEAVALAAEKMN